ncbi:MAG: sugar transferase [Planctomycetota bacterium]
MTAPERFWNWLRGSRDNGTSVPGVHSLQRFRDLIARERAVSDRGGYEFSIVVFEPADTEGPDYAKPIANALRRRIRSTDTVGWFDEKVIGVLLPHTSAAGAWKLGSDIDALLKRGPAVTTLVYTYPNGSAESRPLVPPHSNDNGGDGNGVGSNGSAPGNNGSVKDRRGTGPELAKDGSSGEQTQYRAHRNSSDSLEPYFARPLPAWKRTLDIVGSITALILLAPLMLLIALAIRLTSRGPALFLQERAGRGNRPFRMVKFRTMIAGAEEIQSKLRERNERSGPAFKMKRDPRVTTVGRVLRRFSLDELPQFYNVLRGDMSLVGPRPLPFEESEICTGWLRRRLELTPGVTGLWQVSGRSEADFDEWVRLDLRYARGQSLLLDLKLLALTVPAVLVGRGAH